MRSIMTPAIALLLAALFPSAEARAATPDPAEIHGILDGKESDEEAAERLGALGVEPASLAALLRAFTPAGNPLQPGHSTAELTAPDGRTTELSVYVPKAYDGSRPFPLAVVLHGRGGNGGQMTALLAAAAERWGWCLVAPTAQPFPGMLPIHPHWWTYGASGFPVQALLWARKNLFVADDRVLLTGYSMGGFGTWNVALRFPDRFVAAAPFAGGIAQSEYLGTPDRKRRSLLANAAMVHLFVAHGGADPVVPARFDRESHKTLEEAGIPHAYHEIEGGKHILPEVTAAGTGDFEKGWLIRELFDALAKRTRPAPGDPFSFTALEAGAAARWVTVEAAGTVPCRVEGRTGPGGVELVSEGVDRVTVWFDGLLPALDEAVTVTWQGQEVFRGAPAASLLAVVKSWRATRDRRRVFVASLALDAPAAPEEGF